MPLENRTENINEEDILRYLSKRGGFVQKVPTTGYFDAKTGRHRKHVSSFVKVGVSDISYLENGTLYVFEVKSDAKFRYIKKHLYAIMQSHGLGLNKEKKHIFNQGFYIDEIKRNGGQGDFVARIDDVIEILNRSNDAK